jgi:hypothetical protein
MSAQIIDFPNKPKLSLVERYEARLVEFDGDYSPERMERLQAFLDHHRAVEFLKRVRDGA